MKHVMSALFFVLLAGTGRTQTNEERTIYGFWELRERTVPDGTLLYSADSTKQLEILDRMLKENLVPNEEGFVPDSLLTRTYFEDYLFRVGKTTYTFTSDGVLYIQYFEIGERWTFHIDTSVNELFLVDPIFERIQPIDYRFENGNLLLQGPDEHLVLSRNTTKK